MPDDAIDPVDALLESAVARFLSGEAVDLDSIIAANRDHADAIRSRWAAIQNLRDPFGPMLQSVAAPAQPITAGAHIGEFEIIRELGRGGMGVVFEAMQKNPRRSVALKVIRGSAYVDDHAVRMFQREIAALARLKHPGIAAIYGAGATEDGRHFFAMELVQGVPLLDYVRKNKLTRKQQLELFIRICEAVNYAHQRGVIHRDLKPGNILIEADGNPKVLDFGLARVTDVDVNVTTAGIDAGRIQGTLPYISPEQVQGHTDQIDIRTDVYSLGVILYQLLTGALPHELSTSSIPQAIRTICEETPKKPSTIDNSLRGDLQTISLKAIEREPTLRYQSAAEFEGDIRRYLLNKPIVARPASAWYQLQKFVRRNRLVAALVIVGFLSLTIYAASISLMSAKLTKERDRAKEAEAVAVEARDRAQSERHLAVESRKAEADERKRAQAAETQTMTFLSRSEEINEFFVYLFGIPRLSSDKPKGNPAKAVLDEGQSVVTLKGNSLTDGTRAALLETLGRCYSGLGEFRAAEKLLREAVQMNERLFSESDKRCMSAMVNLAMVLIERQNFDEAKQIATDAVRIGRSQSPALDVQLIRGLVSLGEASRQGQGFAPQLVVFEEAYRLAQSRFGDNDPESMRAAVPYGIALLEANRNKEAAKVLSEVTDVIVSVEHFAAAGKVLDRLNSQMSRGELDFETFEAVARSVLALSGRYAGPEDPQVLKVSLWLASLYAVNGNSRGAVDLLRKVIPIIDEKFGETDQRSMLAQAMLGEALVCLQQYEEAERVLTQVLELQKKKLGSNHSDLCRAYGGLATIHSRWARFEEAEQCLNQVIAIRKKNLPQYHGGVAASIGQLGYLRGSEGRYEEAVAILREALDNHNRSAIQSPLLRRYLEVGIAGCQIELEGCVDAQNLAARMLLEVDESSRNNCLMRASCLLIHSDCCLKKGEYNKAVAYANEAIALRAKAGDFGAGIVGEAEVYIGTALIRLGDQVKGRESLTTAISELKAYSTPTHPMYRRALDELKDLSPTK